MERISGDGFFSYRRDVERKRDAKRTRRAATGTFHSDLRDVEASGFSPGSDEYDHDEDTAKLLDAVFEAGDHLKRHADADSFQSYRAAVKRFMSAVVERGIAIEERTSGSNILKRKRYALVRVIDGKLEQLAAGMVSSQRDQLDMLARVDEINGLLVDLRH